VLLILVTLQKLLDQLYKISNNIRLLTVKLELVKPDSNFISFTGE
jgi:hypothetical protein